MVSVGSGRATPFVSLRRRRGARVDVGAAGFVAAGLGAAAFGFAAAGFGAAGVVAARLVASDVVAAGFVAGERLVRARAGGVAPFDAVESGATSSAATPGPVTSATSGCSAASAAALRACLALWAFASAFEAAFPLPFFWAFATWVLLAGLGPRVYAAGNHPREDAGRSAMARRPRPVVLCNHRVIGPPGGGSERSPRSERVDGAPGDQTVLPVHPAPARRRCRYVRSLAQRFYGGEVPRNRSRAVGVDGVHGQAGATRRASSERNVAACNRTTAPRPSTAKPETVRGGARNP